MATCWHPACERPAAVRLHIPWTTDRTVCPSHARAFAQRDGVVAEPLDGAEEHWP